MPTDSTAWFLILFTSALTFIIARSLGTKYRERRKEREEEARRAGESRQARRARERKARGKAS